MKHLKHYLKKIQKNSILRSCLIFLGVFAGAILFCSFYGPAEGLGAYASPIFVLAVLLVSRFTDGYIYGLVASLLGVICVNFFFTYPYMAVNFSISGYPLTFLTLLIVSLITGTLTTRAKQRDQLKSENEREKIRSDLLRSISHDIRTPLTSIIGATTAVLEDDNISREETKELLTDAQEEAEWLLRMVENLLMITKIDQDQEIHTQAWAVEEIIGEVIFKLQKTYPWIPIEISIPDTPLFVPMDPLLIEQVLFNLAENSILHGETADTVWIRVSNDKHSALFTVSDNGMGFSDEILLSFRRNAPLTEVSPDSKGKRNMGLGLQVCNAIIKAHNGTLTLRNTQEGAQASFTLPLDVSQAAGHPAM